ncbi:iron ABC transporter permease, partial [Oxalobacteraceae bacterium OM1]
MEQTRLSAGANRRRTGLILSALTAAAFASLLFACATGSVRIGAADLWIAIRDLVASEPSSLASTLLQLRLGRALSAFVTGAMLSLAGVMMQALLRNPLADPYVLGVSGGASVAALAAILLGSAAWMVDGAAFAGAIAVALLLLALAFRDLRGASETNATTLLLTGVILSSGCGALVTLMLSLAPD